MSLGSQKARSQQEKQTAVFFTRYKYQLQEQIMRISKGLFLKLIVPEDEL